MGLLPLSGLEGDIHSQKSHICMRTSHTHTFYIRVVPRGIPGAFLNLVSYFFVLLISRLSLICHLSIGAYALGIHKY